MSQRSISQDLQQTASQSACSGIGSNGSTPNSYNNPSHPDSSHRAQLLNELHLSPRNAPLATSESSILSSTVDLDTTPRSTVVRGQRNIDIESLFEQFDATSFSESIWSLPFEVDCEDDRRESTERRMSTPKRATNTVVETSTLSVSATAESGVSPGPETRITPQRSLFPSLTSSDSGLFCRICHEGDGHEELIAPCKCSGTMGLLHQSCIEKWLGSTNSDKCEICGFEYLTNRQPKSFKQWLNSPARQRDRRNLIGDSICLCLLTPLASVSAWLCISGARNYARYDETKWEAAGLITLSVFLLLIFLVWCMVAVRYHYRVYQDWRSVNQVVRVLGLADSVRQLIAPPGPSASSPRPSSYSGNRDTLGSFSETVLTPVVLQNASRYLPSHIMRNLLSPRPSPAVSGLATETTRSQTSDLCPTGSVSDTVLLLPLNRSVNCVRETYV